MGARHTPMSNYPQYSRRGFFAASAAAVFGEFEHAEAAESTARDAPVPARDNLNITRLETFLVKPRWLFLKVHTNAGIVGLGEPILEGRANNCAEAVKEIEPYLVGRTLAAWCTTGRPSTGTRSIAEARC